MMLLLATLLSSSSALAAEDGSDRRWRLAGPPIRVELRSVFRDGMAPAPLVEVGVQAVRRGSFTLDGAVAYQGHATFGSNGPWRTMGAVDAGVDGLYEIGNWLAVGPTAGLSFRIFRQQFTDITSRLMPVVGARTHIGVVRARRWSLGISGKLTADLVRTELVLETAEIVPVSPFAMQVGARVQFGHGRDRRKSSGGRS